MRLSECLNTADSTTLRRIAEYYDLSCSRHSKLSLMQEIVFSFRNKAFMQTQLKSWQEQYEPQLLRLSLDQRTIYPHEEITALFQSAGDSGEGIERAMRQGWLFRITHVGGRLMYCIPEELHAELRRFVVSAFESKLNTSDEGPLTFQEEAFAMCRDLDVFLEYIRHHDVRLTNDGSMYKRNLLQVLELLEVGEDPLQGGWRFGYGRRFHDYPDRLALMYDFAYSMRFVEERDDGTLSVSEESERWAQTSEMDRQGALVRFYIQLYRRAILRLPQIVQLIAHVSSTWVNSRSMLEAVSPLVNEYYYDTQQQVWETRILKMLMHLGVIRTGSDEPATQWFQITKLGQQLLMPDEISTVSDDARERQRILIVQPNFEIVVTADQPLVTAELAAYTELRQAGMVRIYRLTEDSAQRAMASGKSLTQWLEFLQRHSQTPVPGNVERTILEWNRNFGSAEGSLSS